MNKIKEYKKIVDDAKVKLEKLGVVKNYDTSEKYEYLNKIISKYQQLITFEAMDILKGKENK